MKIMLIQSDDDNGEDLIVELNIDSHNAFKLTGYKEAVENADIIVFHVAHEGLKDLDQSMC